jgi:diguanylate cyclase (GGDEF)-like protein
MEQTHRGAKTPDFELTTKADKLQLLYSKTFPPVVISLINAGLLLFALWQHIDHSKLLIWYAAIIVGSAIRTVLFLRYQIRSPQGEAILSWERPYFVTLMFSALVWGVGGLWLIAEVSAEDQLLTYFFLMGMAGGAIAVYSAIRLIVLVAVASVLVPATIWFLIFGNGALFSAAVGSALFLAFCMRTTKVLSTALHQSLMLSHELRHAKNVAETMAKTDYLTGLNNRGAFHDIVAIQLTHCERHNFPASLIALDLDNFKNINDTYGHSVGDDALRYVSKLVKRNTRASDVCGRMGGEEFTIFLPNTEIEDATVAAEKIRSALEHHPLENDGQVLRITASFGVATGEYKLETLTSVADRALYEAKGAGKNCIRRCSGAVVD